MRVLVCGGRDYADLGAVWSELDTLHNLPPSMGGKGPISLLVQGGAKGADDLALKWAISNRVQHRTAKANWLKHGKAAGPVRNQQMLDQYKPNLVLAFPGGAGTADMVRRARACGISVREVEP